MADPGQLRQSDTGAVAQQLEDVFLPLVRLYRPRVLVPAHHDELWANVDGSGLSRLFANVSTETIKEREHDEFPASVTVRPALIEPVTIRRSGGEISLGERDGQLRLHLGGRDARPPRPVVAGGR